MNKLLLTTFTTLFFLSGCTNTPPKLQAQVKEGHFRVENFKGKVGRDKTYVHLMCYRHKPTVWATPKQYVAGDHILWVRAEKKKRSIWLEGFTKFELTMQEGISYQLNQKALKTKNQKERLLLWIQESESGKIVSQKKAVTLNSHIITWSPVSQLGKLRHDQCNEGTI